MLFAMKASLEGRGLQVPRGMEDQPKIPIWQALVLSSCEGGQVFDGDEVICIDSKNCWIHQEVW